MLNRFKHRCNYEATAISRSGGGVFAPPPFTTTILWRCRCGNVDSTTIVGRWTLQQVRGEAPTPAAPTAEAGILECAETGGNDG